MAQKVKIISFDNAMIFEQQVNDFIRDKKVIDIKYQAYVLATQYTNYVPSQRVVCDRVLIIYEEENND